MGGGASDDQACREFLEALRAGDLCTGTVTEVARSGGVTVTLDGFPARPLGTVGPLDLSWRRFPASEAEVGQRITRSPLTRGCVIPGGSASAVLRPGRR